MTQYCGTLFVPASRQPYWGLDRLTVEVWRSHTDTKTVGMTPLV